MKKVIVKYEINKKSLNYFYEYQDKYIKDIMLLEIHNNYNIDLIYIKNCALKNIDAIIKDIYKDDLISYELKNI